MEKLNSVVPALKQIAVCLPPVLISLIGLAALSRRKRPRPVVADRAPAAPARRRSGNG